MEFVQSNFDNQVHCIACLFMATEVQPQVAHVTMIYSLQFECYFLAQVVPNCGPAFGLLKDCEYCKVLASFI